MYTIFHSEHALDSLNNMYHFKTIKEKFLKLERAQTDKPEFKPFLNIFGKFYNTCYSKKQVYINFIGLLSLFNKTFVETNRNFGNASETIT